MLTVKVILEPWWAECAEDVKIIADMTLYNDGSGDHARATYVAMTHDMRDLAAKRTGEVPDYRRDQDVWNLVTKALQDMGYGE